MPLPLPLPPRERPQQAKQMTAGVVMVRQVWSGGVRPDRQLAGLCTCTDASVAVVIGSGDVRATMRGRDRTMHCFFPSKIVRWFFGEGKNGVT